MRPTLWIAALAVAVTLSSACAADASSAAPEGSAEAQVWFERALALDLGAGGAPDAILAFDAMRRAAEAGHPQAAFNVAVMLDSGRGARRNVAEAAVWYARAAARGIRRAAFNLGQLYESGEGVPANVDLSRAWYIASNLPAARERLAELSSTADRPAHVQAPKPLFPVGKSSLEVGDQQVDLVWTSFLEPEPVRFFV
jgi:TPR repeat protein